MKALLSIVIGIALSGCGAGGTASVDAPMGGDAPPGGTLSEQHPGDVGIGGDPAVVWYEDFEAASVAAVTSRYDQSQGTARMTLVADHAPGSSGAALALRAGGGVDAVDLFKQLPGHDEIYVRWYAKYEAGVPWHHSGVWVGGYNPSAGFPSPHAGERPNGNDRFSISIEPVWGTGGANPRFDFYNYWMTMHSWMAAPTNDGTSYFGNALVHKNGFTIDEGQWVCVEVHAKLNPNPATGAGAVLEVFKNDANVMRFDDRGPIGYWIRDKFCPTGADGAECADFPAPANEKLDPALAKHDRACFQRVLAAELHHRSGTGDADARSDGRRDPTHRLHPLSTRSRSPLGVRMPPPRLPRGANYEWYPKFYRALENPFVNNRNMGTFDVTLPTTGPSVMRLMNGNMDLDITVSVRTVY